MSKTTERIEGELGIPGLIALLSERLSPTDLQSLLLEVYRAQAEKRSPAAVLADYESNRFVRPSTASPVRLAEWERIAFASLPDGFEAVALSPVSPLGTSSAVGLVDQNRVVSTIRNSEVVSDSTNVLALECAVRRRKMLRENPKSRESVHLAASHRLLRAQKYDNPNSIPHFSAFALCSAGRDTGNWQFELETLAAHIGFYIRALRAFAGSDLKIKVAMTVMGQKLAVLQAALAPLHRQFETVEWAIDDERTGGKDYYADGLCFHLYAAAPAGAWLELVDGGAVDWTQKLLSSAKERCVISGIGSERVCMEWTSM